MARDKCGFAYRKMGDVSIHCTAQKKPFDYCAHQYMCHQTKRWELSPPWLTCPLRKKEVIDEQEDYDN